MRRRTFFSLLGTASLGGLAGCSTLPPLQTTPEVDSATIKPLARICTESPEESASIASQSEDGTLIGVMGTIATPRAGDELYVDAQNGVGDPERDNADIEVHIDFLPPDTQRDRPDCAGQIGYRAEIQLTQQPETVTVRHTTREDGSYVLKTIATQSLGDA